MTAPLGGAEDASPLRLLLVDDDEVDRQAVRRALLAHLPGSQVSECRSAPEAEAALAAGPVDCVLLDFQLPGTDGLHVLRGLRARGVDVAVVVLTGYGDERIAVELMKAGAADYISKNHLAPDRLAQSIRQAVRTHHAERENRRLETERRDLLEREREARRAAEEASRAKDQFLAVVSHELRTPLNSILGWAKMLQSGRLDEAAVVRGLATIERSARHQAQLIEDLLDVSRIIAGKLRLDIRMVEVTPAIRAALDAVRPQASDRGVHMEEELDPEAGSIPADPDRLQQVVFNLLTNSVKFTPRDGRVRVACRRGPADLEIEVSDTGAGIPLDFLPRVFDRFAQAETLGRTPGGGLGLGLAIVRNLVERHGGRVGAHSAGEGQGATFRVSFPLSAATVHRTASSPPALLAADPDHLTGVKVVVVDDHEDTRHLLAEVLGSHGAGVKACATVAEAIEAITADRPDMVVSDIEMPGQDGYALIRHLRGSPQEADVRLPAVALTGSARVEDRVRTLTAGFQMHVPKPVDPAELVHAVAVLSGRTR